MPSIVNPDAQPEEEIVVDMNDEEEFSEIDELDVEAKIIMPEDLDPDTVLFEGGPTAQEIIEWKKEFGHVYVTEISFDEYIIWRTIDRTEYRTLVKKINTIMEAGGVSEVELNMYNEDIICLMAVIFPKLTQETLDKQLAGMPSIISQQILEQSGFRPIDTRGL